MSGNLCSDLCNDSIILERLFIMYAMLKIELKRMKRSYSFWVSLMAGTMLLMLQIYKNVIPLALNPLEDYIGVLSVPYRLYMSWAGGNISDIYMSAYIYMFPILAACAYSITYYTDCKSGYVKNIVTRTSRKNYLIGKYAAAFISGGITVTIPLVLNFMITAALLPAINVFQGEVYIDSIKLMSGLFYSHPLVYVLIFFVIYFVYGGAVACLTLMGTYLVRNVFLLSLFPFVLFYAIDVISQYINSNALLSISPLRILRISGSYATWLTVVGEAVVFILPATVIYFLKSMKEDII